MADAWDGFRAVEHQLHGWWRVELCDVLRVIQELHAERGVHGWIVEFGVFWGRSLAALALLARPTERVLGIDCFEQNEFNASHSGGQASLAATRQSLTLAGVPADRVSLVAMNLAELDASGLENLLRAAPGGYQPIRVMHIDGGHDVRQAKQDLETIVPHLDDMGVLLLDDVYNHQWPEVALAFSHFLATHAGWDVIGCFHSRILMVRQEAGPLYREVLTRSFGPPWQTFLGRPYFTVP